MGKHNENNILLMSGNEAAARGAWEAGCTVAAAYPGTPSTEILEEMARYPEVNAEWSINEKVALEVGAGASYAGARTLVSMKHVGLNVAADPLFTLSYTGVRGGLVIIECDDPQLHSSQNEQDNRHYARAAKLPMLEPSDSAEAHEFTKLAFGLSERFDCPVLVRPTTRVSHAMSLVKVGERQKGPVPLELKKDKAKLVMLPGFARPRHPILEERMRELEKYVETFEGNRIEMGDTKIGIITAGISYMYTKEALPDASILKLGMAWPMPKRMIKEFASKVEKLYVVEELDPFIEDFARGLGLDVTGKAVLPICGEFNPAMVRKAILGDGGKIGGGATSASPQTLPPRPPIMCPGCPHRGLFWVLRKEKLFVCGDIGCYTLSAQKPFEALDTCLCMGAGVGQAFGMEKALGEASRGRVVSVIGDSTFAHSGITPLADIAHNGGRAPVIILDNRTTAMTGRQGNPVSGMNARGEPATSIDLEALAKSLGIPNVWVVNPFNIEETKKAVRAALESEGPSVIIARGPCALIREFKEIQKPPMFVDKDICDGCRTCLMIACPAVTWVAEGRVVKGKKRKGYAVIDELMCVGCGVCSAVCKEEAIKWP